MASRDAVGSPEILGRMESWETLVPPEPTEKMEQQEPEDFPDEE